jgi:hypothetical protein
LSDIFILMTRNYSDPCFTEDYQIQINSTGVWGVW